MGNMIAAIHVTASKLGLSDDDRRAVYEVHTGKRSLISMTDGERQKVYSALSQSAPRNKSLEGPYAKKLQALWISGWHLGVVRDKTDQALLHFIERQTGIQRTEFLRNAADARKAVEALKAMLARDAGVIWGSTNGREWLSSDAAKCAWAGGKLLAKRAGVPANKMSFIILVFEIIGHRMAGLDAITEKEWQDVLRSFGRRIRRGRK